MCAIHTLLKKNIFLGSIIKPMLLSTLTILIGFVILSYVLVTLPSLAYATSASNISSAEVVHSSESMKVPPSVGTFIILIPNEAHENWSDEQHKLITDKNSYYVPTNLIIPTELP